jgi:predicted nucleotidyltransferase
VSEKCGCSAPGQGNAREDSDVDLAIRLMPPKGNHDWAMGNYCAHGDAWKKELQEIVGRYVSLEVLPYKLLWRRDVP